jgi:hypothetical protein
MGKTGQIRGFWLKKPNNDSVSMAANPISKIRYSPSLPLQKFPSLPGMYKDTKQPKKPKRDKNQSKNHQKLEFLSIFALIILLINGILIIFTQLMIFITSPFFFCFRGFRLKPYNIWKPKGV